MRRADIMDLTGVVLRRLDDATHNRIPYTDAAFWLLMGTMAAESDLHANRQIGRGPARGLVQMEPATALDHGDWLRSFFGRRYFGFASAGKHVLEQVTGLRWGAVFKDSKTVAFHLEQSLALQITLARLHYWRVPAALPTTLEAKAAYWKTWYNTDLGRGTPELFTERFIRHFQSVPAAQALIPEPEVPDAP